MSVNLNALSVQFDSVEEAQSVLDSLVKKWEGCLILRDPAGSLVESISEIIDANK